LRAFIKGHGFDVLLEEEVITEQLACDVRIVLSLLLLLDVVLTAPT